MHMKCGHFLSYIRLLLCAVAASGSAAGEARGADGEVSETLRREGIHWPGEGGKQIEVSIGIYVVDFARINLREESFDMAGYLDTRWVDPTIALKGDERKGRLRRFRPGQIWSPALEFVNAIEQANAKREGDLYVTDDGLVTQRVRFSHNFQSPLRLQRFPFDSQVLTIHVAPFDPFARDLKLVVDTKRVGKLNDASVTDWDILEVNASARPDGDDSPGERYDFRVVVRRRYTFYFWRVLLPMTLLVVASWAVFWFDVTNLQPQISTSLAILLSLVTFTYAIDFSLPKVAYLTFIDRYTLTAFSFVLSSIFTVSTMHVVLRRKGVEAATLIQSTVRPIFPLAFVVAVSMVAILSFR
ncbi:hypothetical protein [Singulisphaera sp. PoT]|uniref:hypothetical protein n=1 Tax=Singulisphaera sp. PoT TaxID=3411797 RepID=UPI003BF5E28B